MNLLAAIDHSNSFKGTIQDSTPTEISSYLLKMFDDGKFGSFNLSDRESYSDQIKNQFDMLKITDLQEKFKQGLIHAIADWSPDAHSINILLLLSSIAAACRASEVIDYLRIIIEDEWLENFKDVDYEEAVGEILAILSGFAPSPKVKSLFRRLFYDAHYLRFTAQTLIGLCRCDPDDFLSYFPHFVCIQSKHPEFFEINYVLSELVRTVSVYRILNYRDKLDANSKSLIDSYIDEERLDLFEKSNVEPIVSIPRAELLKDLEIVKNHLIRLSHIPSEEDKGIAHRENLIKNALQIVRQKLHSQIAAIYLFSKEGKLACVGVEGVDHDGAPIDEEKYCRLSFSIDDQFFIPRTVEPEEKGGFGKAIFVGDFSTEDIPDQILQFHADLIGNLNCAISVPLNGQNKTYGVLAIINKVDPEHDKPLSACSFKPDEFHWLSAIGISVANAISNLRRNRQRLIRSSLVKLLSQTSGISKDIQDVYDSITEKLTSEYTSFKACILRAETSPGRLEVVAKSGALGVDMGGRKEEVVDLEINTNDKGSMPKKTVDSKRLLAFHIDENTIERFGNNKEWVVKNDFKSYALFPLMSGESVVGTLSLYVGYEYTFHQSCKEFINEIAFLIASFIKRQLENKKYKQLHSGLDKVSENVNSQNEKANQELNKLKNIVDSLVLTHEEIPGQNMMPLT